MKISSSQLRVSGRHTSTWKHCSVACNENAISLIRSLHKKLISQYRFSGAVT